MSNLEIPQTASRNEVFASYGEALFLAQSMESGMQIFYWLDKVLPDTPPGKAPRIDFTAEPLSELNMNSLGGYVRQFRRELMEEGTVDIETRSIMRKLEQAASDRNILVHSYWWDRALLFGTSQGRNEMLKELSGLITRFRYCNAIIRHLVLLCLGNFGLSPEKIDSPEFQGYLVMSDQDSH